MPKRIQRKRTKGWKMPENAAYVGRPSKWGNSNRVGDPYPFVSWHINTVEDAVNLFEVDMKNLKLVNPEKYEELIAPLRGKDLACWCAEGAACHADVLLKLANQKG